MRPGLWKALRVDWFGWRGRASLPARGPRWFVSRGANYLYFSLGGFCSISLPWFWSREAIDSRGYYRGFNAGFESGYNTRILNERKAAQ